MNNATNNNEIFTHFHRPLNEVASQKAYGTFTASHSCLNIVHNKTRHEISLMIADSVTLGFNGVQNSTSHRLVVQRTAAEEHVVVHFFSETFVAVERTELPSGEQLDSQTIADGDDRQ